MKYKSTDTGTSKTAITPTNTGGSYDWTELGDGFYTLEIPASDNDTEGGAWVGGTVTDSIIILSPVYDIFDSATETAAAAFFATLSSGQITAASIATDAITAAKIAADAITSSELATSALNAISDDILKRDWTAVTGEASRSVLNALRSLRNKITIGDNGGDFVVTKEDDSTEAWKATGGVTRTNYDAITAIDPD